MTARTPGGESAILLTTPHAVRLITISNRIRVHGEKRSQSEKGIRDRALVDSVCKILIASDVSVY